MSATVECPGCGGVGIKGLERPVICGKCLGLGRIPGATNDEDEGEGS